MFKSVHLADKSSSVLLNSLSAGTEAPGIIKYFFTSFSMLGYMRAFSFHHFKASFFLSIIGILRYCCISVIASVVDGVLKLIH